MLKKEYKRIEGGVYMIDKEKKTIKISLKSFIIITILIIII